MSTWLLGYGRSYGTEARWPETQSRSQRSGSTGNSKPQATSANGKKSSKNGSNRLLNRRTIGRDLPRFLGHSNRNQSSNASWCDRSPATDSLYCHTLQRTSLATVRIRLQCSTIWLTLSDRPLATLFR